MLDFMIPVSKDDLLIPRSDRYVSRNVVGPEDVVKKFSACSEALRNDGYKFVLEHFDVLFSISIHCHRLSWENLKKGWAVLLKASKAMINDLKSTLQPNHELSEEIRRPAANATKMLVYLLTQLMSGLEDRVKRIGDSKIKKKGSQNTFSEQTEWQEFLDDVVVVFHDLLHLPLIWLWDPPVPSTEESFYNLISNMAFSILENPLVVTSKMTLVKETLLHIIGVMVVRYNCKINIVFRMVGILNRVEHIAAPIALAVKILYVDYNCHSIVREVIKEITECYSSDVLPQAQRNHGIFFTELSELAPESLKVHLQMILPMLEQENVTLRNGVLSAMSSIVINCLSNKDMSTADRRQRDQLLDYLLEYIYDSNAFVRAKVLSLWRKLLDENAVPQTLRCDVLEATSGRIIDTAASVRKAAIQLVTAFLEYNPASAKLGVAVLQEQVETERNKLKAIHDKYREGNPRETKWLDMQPSIEGALQEYFEKKETENHLGDNAEVQDDDDADDPVNETEENDDAFFTAMHCEMCEALDNHKYIKALNCAVRIEHFAPDYILKRKENSIKEKINFYMLLMGCFYTYDKLSSEVLTKDLQSTPLDKEEAQQLTAQQHYVAYLEDSLNFVNQMENALVMLQKLLLWAVSNEGLGVNDGIVDAVRLVEVAHVGGVPGAKDCMKTELQLILHQPEVPVVSAIAASAKTVYFQCVGSENMSRNERTVASLIKLLAGLNVGEALAVEELMKQWVKNGDITGGCVQVMWEMFMHPELAPQPEDRNHKQLLALTLLRMVGTALPERVRSLVPKIATSVFAVRENKIPNLEIAAEACAVLSSTCPSIQHNHTAPVSSVRLPIDHILFKELSEMLKATFWLKESNHYVPFAINAVNLIYLFCLSPEPFVEDYLKFMVSDLQAKRTNIHAGISPNSKNGEEAEESQTTQISHKEMIPCFALGRFLAVVGHIAMMQMIFMDTAVYSKIRSLEEKDKLLKTQKQYRGKKNKKKVSRSKSVNNTSKINDESNLTPGSPTSIQSNDIEEDEEGTQAEDRVSESIRQVCEIEIFKPERILGQLLPVVVTVLSKPKSYAEPNVQRTAMLSLSKMMMVSSTICADNIQLFVTVMNNSSDADTRAVAIIAIADITLRFPSIVEPWSKYIYGRLRDSSDQVRLTTILILSRLVMCDMIKVRGQISDLALCISDENKTVANAAKKFFCELSEKHNVLYNVLPDIISGLCSSDLIEEQFNNIVRFVFGRIKKEKQIEVLVEKLCQRFQLVTTDRQACDIAFCLTLLNYNNRALGRLTDQIQTYADKLHIEKVYSYFKSIVNTHSKNKAKMETKTAAEELGAAMEQILQVRSENPDEPFPMHTPSRRTKATPRSTRASNRNVVCSATAKKSAKKRGRKKDVWSSDDELPEIAKSP